LDLTVNGIDLPVGFVTIGNVGCWTMINELNFKYIRDIQSISTYFFSNSSRHCFDRGTCWESICDITVIIFWKSDWVL